MRFHNTNTDQYVPGGGDLAAALKRTTHLGIGAHQDDLEIAMIHGVLECFGRADRAFTGVTCTDGAGSARTGLYAAYTNEAMMKVRQQEQRTAAVIGGYAAMLQLGYSSKEVRNPADARLADDLVQVLKATRPKVVYTHNPADKHATHVGVVASVIRALRRLPAAERPERVLGCECWRGLDWLPDDRKVALDVSAHSNLTAALLGVYDSQIAGGKRYDLAAVGRFRANATFFESHAVDKTELAVYAMDLTPLVQDDRLAVSDYVAGLADAMKAQMASQLAAVGM
jgi:LmbE family N-acetylglucosaminyl deacetylase